MPILLNVLLVASAFVAGSLVTAAGYAQFDYIKTFFPPLIALVGTFAGARVAFEYNIRKDREKQGEDQRGSANRAMFALSIQLSDVMNLKDEFIDPVRHRATRAFDMRPDIVPHDHLLVDLDSLAFVLNGGNPEALAEVAYAQETGKRAFVAQGERSNQLLEVQ